MKVALDTNRLTDLFRGDSELASWLGARDAVYIPLPVLAEIRAGFLGGSRQAENEAVLHQFLAKPTVGILCPDRTTADQYARLFFQLKSAGTPIPINDIWIAALALQHNLSLVTRDDHFEKVPQLIKVSR